MGLEDTTEEYLYVRWLRERDPAGLPAMTIDQWRAERASSATRRTDQGRRRAFKQARPFRTAVSSKGLRRIRTA